VSDAELPGIAARVAGLAREGEEIEVYVVRSRDTEIEVFDGEVESLSVAGVEGVGVRVVRDHRQGYAWAGSLDADVVDATLADARENSGFGAPDEWYGIASTADAAGAVADLDLWRDDVRATSTDDKVALALGLEAATRASDPSVRGVESCGYGDSAVEVAIATSTGVQAATARTTCSAYAVALAGDGADTQTGYGFTAARAFADLDLDSVPRDASERAVRLLGARQPATRRLPVVLDPLVTRSLLGIVSSAFDGDALLKGRSLFEGRAGEQVAAAAVTIVDDPTDPRALGAAARDSEGVPTRRNVLIDAGTLRGFLHNVYTGRRSGSGTTGSAIRGFKSLPGVGVRALRMEPGSLSPEEILAAAGEALYVQSVSGLHSGTNVVSGAFSVGAEGLIVRHGALAEPVREVTIASTLQRILLDVAEVGADLTFLPGAVAGQTVLVSEMTMSGA
jgi:PmbA protein